MGLALFYGGLVQLLAGMWEFKTGNTFGATVFSSYGGFWMSFAALFMNCFGFIDPYLTTSGGPYLDDLNNDLGIYLLAWSFYSLLMAIAAHRSTVALVLLLWLVHMTFLMLCIGKFMGGDLLLQRAGGAFGIVAALVAWYCALAAMLTEKTSFFRLPLGELDPIYRKWGWLPPLDRK
jgi:uncharacterized protein